MRNAIKSLGRIKLMAFLIILQLSISLMLVNSAGVIIENTMKKAAGFNSLMNFDKSYLLRIVNGEKNIPKTLDDYKANQEYYDSKMGLAYLFADNIIDDINNAKDRGLINKTYYNFPLPGLFTEQLPKEILDNYSDEELKPYSLLVNYDFINDYNLNVSEGRTFVKEDFQVDYKKDSIPVILGANYKGKIKVGDIIEMQELGVDGELLNKNSKGREVVKLKTKVIGFLDKDAIPIMFTKDAFIQNIEFSDNYSIIPAIKDLYILNEKMVISDLGVFVEAESPNKIEELKRELDGKLVKEGLEIKVTELTGEAGKIEEVLIRDVSNSAILGGVLLVLSIIGITCVLLGELKERKREFGLRIACGAEIKTLCKELIGEISLMVISASVISIILMLISEYLLNTIIKVSITVIISNIVIVTLLTIIVSISPIMRLKKMNPVDLVRGK